MTMKPFEQQPKESAKAFAAFSLYLSLGPERFHWWNGGDSRSVRRKRSYKAPKETVSYILEQQHMYDVNLRALCLQVISVVFILSVAAVVHRPWRRSAFSGIGASLGGFLSHFLFWTNPAQRFSA
jgi:hypothetical protein